MPVRDSHPASRAVFVGEDRTRVSAAMLRRNENRHSRYHLASPCVRPDRTQLHNSYIICFAGIDTLRFVFL